MAGKFLVPVRGDGKGDNVLAHAAVMAKNLSAHVTITHCRARPEDLMPFGVPIPAFLKKQIVEQSREVANQEEAGMQAELEELCTKLGLDLNTPPPAPHATASWIDEAGRQVDVIKRHGRLADLICVAQPDIDRNLGTNTLKGALFHTGRPVMMCPPRDTQPTQLCQDIAIGWNGSTESARAVALTLPFIERAKTVVVLTSGAEVNGASTSELIEYLSIRGVAATVDRFDAKANAGELLLSRANANGADTLIMGAYGSSHEAETVFGGNTQTVVDKADMPVILVH